MPLKQMLNDNRTFDPKAVALLLEAFDEIVADLDLRTAADREKAAKIVMRLAHSLTQLDASKIRAETARLMRKEGAGAGARSEKAPGIPYSPKGSARSVIAIAVPAMRAWRQRAMRPKRPRRPGREAASPKLPSVDAPAWEQSGADRVHLAWRAFFAPSPGASLCPAAYALLAG